MIEYFLVGVAVGVIAQRIFMARNGGFFKLGTSYSWSNNKVYQWLHRQYCECCPRRLYCEEYKIRKKVK